MRGDRGHVAKSGPGFGAALERQAVLESMASPFGKGRCGYDASCGNMTVIIKVKIVNDDGVLHMLIYAHMAQVFNLYFLGSAFDITESVRSHTFILHYLICSTVACKGEEERVA